MNSIDMKSLKKIADTCRKVGIKHFKNADFEFTLTDDLPEPALKTSDKRILNETEALALPEVQTDGPTEEELLFWSTGGADKNGET